MSVIDLGEDGFKESFRKYSATELIQFAESGILYINKMDVSDIILYILLEAEQNAYDKGYDAGRDSYGEWD